MKTPPERKNRPAAEAARELADLQAQVAAAREELAGLRAAAAEAQPLQTLRDANERLVLATLGARAVASSAEQALEQATQLAELDDLTGLPNRALLRDRLAHAIATAKRHGRQLALLFVDMDNFKPINDAFGHAIGDEALRRAGQALTSCVREADTVSRHGGDEFLVLLDEVGQPSDAARVVDKMIAALAGPHLIGDLSLELAASFGISIYPNDGHDADTLIEHADAGMYQVKRVKTGSSVVHGEAPPARNGESPRRAPADAPESHRQAEARHEMALAEHERRHMHLKEANEQLLLAALSAQKLQGVAERAQLRQTEFLAVMAHELRNPLAPISNAAALLGMLPTEELLPRLQAIIERQVVHMSRLVSDLLDVSRANTGKLRLERRLIDLVDVIEQVASACRPAMDARLQRFDMRLLARVLEVNGDPVRLAQVFSNLLDNASKYTPVGGEIKLSVAVVDAAVVTTVSDNGIGISADALPHVFAPFTQDVNAIGFNGAGLGIGLTVVRELVEAHGGSVVASSAGSGQGSRFMVTLPLAEAA